MIRKNAFRRVFNTRNLIRLGLVALVATVLATVPAHTFAAPINFTGITFSFSGDDLVANIFGFVGLFTPVIAVVVAITLGVNIVRSIISFFH